MDYTNLQAKYDSIKMLDLIDAWPKQFQRAFELGYAVELSNNFKHAKHLVGLGMGGSGMAYTVLATLARSFGTVPLEIISDYNLPPYITSASNTAVCVTSFSGNTEETLSAAGQALERGCPIVCITTGGQLAEWAKKNKLPLIQFEYPVSLPRVALSYTLGIAFGVMCKAEMLKPGSEAATVVSASLANLALFTKIDSLKSQGQSIAKQIKDKMVYIVGTGWSYPLAVRWKGQLNENAKQIAFAEMMPEMCHNMYLGYDLPIDIRRNSAVIFLDSPDDHHQNRKRAELVGRDLASSGATILHPELDAKLTPLARLIAMMMLGDYVSYYLALLNEKDPAEMKRIEDLKKQL